MQRMKWLNRITYSMDMNLSKLHEIVKDREAWHTAVHRVTKRCNWMTEKQKYAVLLFHVLLPSVFPSTRDFSNESVLHIGWPKYWSFSFSISPSNEYSGLISFRVDWLDLLAVQGTLKSLLQHHSSKVSILQCSAFFILQLSHPIYDYWKKP